MPIFCNTLTRFILFCLLVSMLFGCAATYHGDGIVISEQKINNSVQIPSHIKQGAKIGGTVGAISGGVVGAGFGILYFGLGGASHAATYYGGSIFGAALGGVTFGLVGAAIGMSAAYVSEKITENSANYQYTVRSLYDVKKTFTIRQYSIPVPLNTKVKILERNGTMFIRKN